MKLGKKIKGVLSVALSAMLTLGTITANATTTSKNPALPNQEGSGSITIHKYGVSNMPTTGNPATGRDDVTIPNNAVPLEGITFRVQRVELATDETLEDNIIKDEISNSDNQTYALVTGDSAYNETFTTNGDGIAETGQIDLGTYLVTEEQNSSVTEAVEPFIVTVPMTDPVDGDKWIYDVHVYPKNVIKGDVHIDKFVNGYEQKKNTASFGEEVEWIINTTIPQDIYYAQTYKITDTLDSRLNYIGGLEVYYMDGDQKIEIPQQNENGTKYYNVKQPVVTEDNRNPNTIIGDEQDITVSFTGEGFKYLANLYASDIKEIRISFKTIINTSANIEDEIENNAELDYQDALSTEENKRPTIDVPKESRPTVRTGGLKLVKLEAGSLKRLTGAEFKIYNSEDDAKKGINAIKVPGTQEDLVAVSQDGYASFEGLKYGTYWIVETKAPTYTVVVKDSEGNNIEEERHYNLLKEPVQVTVNESSYPEDNNNISVEIFNSKFSLPITGGVGTVIFTLGGLAIMGAAAFLYMRSTRRA